VIESEKQKPVQPSSDRGVTGVVLHTFLLPAFVTVLSNSMGLGEMPGQSAKTRLLFIKRRRHW
jgi:hypothetical protein